MCMLKDCGRCGGDLIMDDGDWRCLQCGQYYYGEIGQPAPSLEPVVKVPAVLVLEAECGEPTKREGYPARLTRGINSFIHSKIFAEAK